MNEKQALDVLGQGINMALAAGAFKNAKDVAILSQATDILVKYIADQETHVCAPEGPTAKEEVVKKVTKKKSK